eukprot:364464-Chlamydomonas_euryale.AAC.6
MCEKGDVFMTLAQLTSTAAAAPGAQDEGHPPGGGLAERVLAAGGRAGVDGRAFTYKKARAQALPPASLPFPPVPPPLISSFDGQMLFPSSPSLLAVLAYDVCL